jgi:hypothetical protein
VQREPLESRISHPPVRRVTRPSLGHAAPSMPRTESKERRDGAGVRFRRRELPAAAPRPMLPGIPHKVRNVDARACEGRERGEKYRLRHRAPSRLEAVNDGDQDVLRSAGGRRDRSGLPLSSRTPRPRERSFVAAGIDGFLIGIVTRPSE